MFSFLRKAIRLLWSEDGLSTLQSVALTAAVVAGLSLTIGAIASNAGVLKDTFSGGLVNQARCFVNDPNCKQPEGFRGSPGVGQPLDSIGGGSTRSRSWIAQIVDWIWRIPSEVVYLVSGNRYSSPTLPTGSETANTRRSAFGDLLQEKPKTTFGDLLKDQGSKDPSAARQNTTDSVVNQNATKTGTLLDVPLHNQNASGKWTKDERVACGPTSLQMAFDYYHGKDSKNKTLTEQEIIQELKDDSKFHQGFGTYESDLKVFAEEQGYDAEYKSISGVDDLRKSIEDEHPVIVPVTVNMKPKQYDKKGNIKNGHFMVVVGVSKDGKEITVNDPNGGVQTIYKYDDFSRALQGSGLVIKPKRK